MSGNSATLTLENKASVPAVFIRLSLVQGGAYVESAYWDDNYVTLWPHEKMTVGVKWGTGEGNGLSVVWDGVNVPSGKSSLG
jgi:exo-1,4-beta-D-glucosaminidase